MIRSRFFSVSVNSMISSSGFPITGEEVALYEVGGTTPLIVPTEIGEDGKIIYIVQSDGPAEISYESRFAGTATLDTAVSNPVTLSWG